MKVLANWYATDEELATVRAGLPKGTDVVLPAGALGCQRKRCRCTVTNPVQGIRVGR